MIVEWEIILDCNYRCEYCTNGRNDLFKPPIKYITDENILYSFIKTLNGKYPNDELFVFGGEPFLHPKIRFIIETLNSFNQPFMIQTNFSQIKIINSLNDLDFIMQLSIHPTQIKDIDFIINNIKNNYSKIRKIDVMFYKGAFEIYKKLEPLFKDKLYMAPVAGFIGSSGVIPVNDINEWLRRFNILKKSSNINFEKGDRSYKWEKIMKGEIITKGSKCIYKDKYILFDPQLNSYNCSHRIKCDICPNKACFLM